MLSRALAVGVAMSGVTLLAGTPWEHPPHPLWVDPEVVKPEPCAMTRVQVERSVWAANLWPSGVVPYVIDDGVTQQNRDRLRIAMNEIETYCGVEFVVRTSQADYIYVQNGSGNNSFIGRIGGGQPINLISWSSRYTIIHELMHALGVHHEHQRGDRDTYVQINPGNIQAAFYNANFPIQGNSAAANDYDFLSIMHYDECALSTCCPEGSICGCPSNCRSIDVRPGYEAFATLIGNRSNLSDGDKLGLEGRYGVASDDAYEDNDSSATAYSIDPGIHGLRLTDTDDYFSAVGSPGGALTVRLRAGLWCSSNVAVTLQTPGGVVLATGTPTDADQDGTYEVTLQTSAAIGPAIIRVRRAQPWGGSYELEVSRACDVQPWKRFESIDVPSPRTGQAMAFDTARGVAVVFGGDADSGLSGSTWEWDGTVWDLRSTSGPSPRVHASMAYDAARGRVVLFGGRSGSTFYGDTWEWDGTSWSSVSTASSPQNRAVAGMSYDSDRAMMVLFGGVNSGGGGGQFGDTWEYDGTNWVQRSTSGPSAREWPALGYDPVQQRTVLFGGSNSSALADTWEWNSVAGTWTQEFSTPPAPAPRVMKNLVFDPVRQQLVMLGGYASGQYFAEEWTYTGSTWSRVLGTVPAGRVSHSAVWDSARGHMLVFGGESASASRLDELWAGVNPKEPMFSSHSWRPIAGTRTPGPLSAYVMQWLDADDAAFLYGGDDGTQRLNRMWLWTGAAWGEIALRSLPSDIPSPRSLSASAVRTYMDGSIEHSELYMFGGVTSSGVSTNEFWVFTDGMWIPLSVPGGPSARHSASMVYDSANDRLVLVSGVTIPGNTVLRDTWLFSCQTGQWTQAVVNHDEFRRSTAMAYDSIRNKVVLFGGYNGSTDLGDTWEFMWTPTSQSWIRVALAGPSPRRGAAAQFDPDRGVVVLQGGVSGSTWQADTWEWNGTNWIEIADLPSERRIDHQLVYDPSKRVMMAHGGYSQPGSISLSDTWEYAPAGGSPTITSEPSDRTNSVGTVATYTVLVDPPESSPSLTYQWYATVNNFGVEGAMPLVNGDRGGRVTQVNGTTLRIANVQASDATSEPVPGVFVNRYFCVASTPCRGVESRRAELSVPAPACSGDTNGDGRVDGADLSVLLGTFNQSIPAGTGADFNADGVVNGADLSVLLGRFEVVC